MLQKLKYVLATMIILSIIFVSCLLCYVSTSNQLVRYEKSNSSLLSFNNTYEQAYNEIIAEIKIYLSEEDSTVKYKITDYVNTFMSCTTVNANHIRFSNIEELQGFETPISYKQNLQNPPALFSLNPQEQSLFLTYLNYNSALLEIALSAMEQGDDSLLHSEDFTNLSAKKDSVCAGYTSHYLTRVEKKIDSLEDSIRLLSILSVFIGTLLVLCGVHAVSLHLKKNQYSTYFNQLYSKAIENSDIGMAIVDKHYKYEYMNSTYKKLFNIHASNPLGQTSFAILPEEISATIPSHTFAESQRNIVLSYSRDGEIRHISYNCFAIFDDKDEPKFISLIQDCTENNKRDAELKQQLKDIEFFANAKSSFIANVSHEIKTPLNVIIGMVHILRNTVLTEKQDDVLAKINISSELLLNIINDVLDISKIQKSNFVLYSSNFNFMNMLNESEEIFAPIIYNKGLEYIKDFNFPSDLCLTLDKTRLAQVLLNLVNNASKFTNSGYIRLGIDQLGQRGSSILLKFTIEDTGMGIDEEDVCKVFQEFEQLENHLTKQHQGTGLGLAICKHVVNAMGGDIWIESKKSVGSKFMFTIWAKTADPATCKPEKKASKGILRLKGEGRKVLVVEDTELNYEVTENLLYESEIVCDHACDGQSAIDMCLSVPDGYYSAILMDIHMPNMDGYTAAEILKTEIGVTCPIIALTATNIDTSTRIKYKDIMDDFVSKPFRYQEFHRALLPYFGSRYEESFSNEDPIADEAPVTGEAFVADRLQVVPVRDDSGAGSGTGSVQYPPAKAATIPATCINLSLSEAAENLGCSEKQYIKHLTKFKNNYAHVDADIQELLIDRNYTEAHRIAHSVKGLAGTLGLTALQLTAAELESALSDESEKAATILTSFKDELDGICKTGQGQGQVRN